MAQEFKLPDSLDLYHSNQGYVVMLNYVLYWEKMGMEGLAFRLFSNKMITKHKKTLNKQTIV